MSVVKSKRARTLILVLAAVIFLIAIVWSFIVAQNDPLSEIVGMLREYGYRVYDSDLYIAGDYRNTSIGALLTDVDLLAAQSASRAAGFPSDVDRVGDVVLILAATTQDEVITLYALDGQMELCFIQYTNSGEVGVLGETKGQP